MTNIYKLRKAVADRSEQLRNMNNSTDDGGASSLLKRLHDFEYHIMMKNNIRPSELESFQVDITVDELIS